MQLNEYAKEFKSLTLVESSQGTCLHIENQGGTAIISMYGAHLLSFVPKHDARERLWLSDKAIFDGKTPIRGGVPICWPWFGGHRYNAEYPSHGFVRNQNWELLDVLEVIDSDAEDKVIATKCIFAPTTLGCFSTNEKLKVSLVITITQECSIELHTHNESDSDIELSQAIHTYFKVPDITEVQIKGIESDYFDKPSNTQDNNTKLPYTIASEVDRVHQHSSNDAQAIQICSNKTLITNIVHKGHNANVVWNPWQEKSRSMKDMSDSGYLRMLCIEAATEPRIILPAGERHTLIQNIA